MSGKTEVTFDTLLGQRTWTDYGAFLSEAPRMYADDVELHVREEAELVRRLREHPSFQKLDVYKVGAENLAVAETTLKGGRVVGVDGTVAKYRLFSGTRCQIGVVAVNYLGDKIRHSFFISQASLREEPEDALERVANRMTSNDDLSDLAIRGLMLYREREAGLDSKFSDCYVMYHGPLLPFELMSGLGRLRALPATLELLRKMVRKKLCLSIVSSTAYQDYLTFGRALEPGEYLTASSYNVGKHLVSTASFMEFKNKWRPDEYKIVEEFIGDYAEKIMIGVIRIGSRPYVFHAHHDVFHEAAAIIARDSMFQREKGFPLLIDYADTLCSQYFSSGEFKSLIEWELAKHNAYLTEAPERELRLK